MLKSQVMCFIDTIGDESPNSYVLDQQDAFQHAIKLHFIF